MTKNQVQQFQELIFRWFDIHQRDLPWRHTHDPYAVLVSEVMLQQTQVDRVKGYWTAWLKRWPTFAALAQAPTADVIRAWKGLGYNRRAVNLQRAAQFITESGGFDQFDTPKKLQKIPGIGPGTAGALMNFVWNIDTPFLEVNLKRIFQRLAFGPETQVGWRTDKDLLVVAEAVLPIGAARIWPHALMDFGALACRPNDPWCERCPMGKLVGKRNLRLSRESPNHKVQSIKKEKARFEETNRYWRGRILDSLRLATEPVSVKALFASLPTVTILEFDRFTTLLRQLEKEGLLVQTATGFRLP